MISERERESDKERKEKGVKKRGIQRKQRP